MVWTVPQFGPSDLLSSEADDFRRVKVESGQTSLHEGRDFRIVRKVTIPSATPLVFRFTCAIDFILFEQELHASVGDIEFYAWRDTQGAPTGVYDGVIPVIAKNISNIYRTYGGARYATQTTVTTGGDFTPTDANLYVDYDRAKTSGATAQQMSIGGGSDTTRFLAAGTYYLVFISLDATSVGRINLGWEERPNGIAGA